MSKFLLIFPEMNLKRGMNSFKEKIAHSEEVVKDRSDYSKLSSLFVIVT